MKIVLGLTGLMRSGKDFAAEYISKKYNYTILTMSDIIKEELIQLGKEPSKMNISIYADELRKLYGNDIIMKRTLEKVKDFDKVIITGVRSPEEVDYIKINIGNFKLFFIEASKENRYKRRTINDPQDLLEFFVRDQRDIIFKGLDKVIEKADFKINNDSTEENLYSQLDNIMSNLEYKRPSWDEYFMNLVEEVSKRGTCDRGRTGVIIVKDKRIIATGYVGSPKGIKHCDEVGHQLKITINEDNTKSMHCLRTIHAELNAICQAAKFGISIEGTTIYCRMEPCYNCAKAIINSGIKRVVAQKAYHASKEARELFKEAGICFEILNDEIVKYDSQ